MTLFDLDAVAAPQGLLRRVRMTVAYDGTRFRGFAPNAGVRTVGGVVSAALARVLGHGVTLTCAGRTDAGVHAWGQVITFDAEAGRADPSSLKRSLNGLLGPEVVVRDASLAPEGFDARRSALTRRYRYLVLNRQVGDPFLARTSWHVEAPLDLVAMQLACDPLVGEHDFGSFCRRPRTRPGVPPPSTVRRVLDARWADTGEGLLRFDIEASSFCQQMVRSVVGTMVEMGEGRRRPGEMAGIVRACDRSTAGRIAPPHGLTLWSVGYPREASES